MGIYLSGRMTKIERQGTDVDVGDCRRGDFLLVPHITHTVGIEFSDAKRASGMWLIGFGLSGYLE